MSACDSCPSKSGCTSQSTCPSANGGAAKPSAPQKEAQNANSNIKTVIGVASGKGGVGKSFVTTMLAIELSRKGYKVGIMDADITGPSIPRAFGLKETLTATEENHIVPAESATGIKAVSLNLLMEDEDAPVIWRGPVVSGLVKQFWTDVDWGMLDVLLIDMPPGTSDVPLTVFQSIPLDGLVLVSTPQDLVSMIVSKQRNMAKMMKVNILGLVENMSYIKCPHCDEKIALFGNDMALKRASEEAGVKILDKLPLDPETTSYVDTGRAEAIKEELLTNTVAEISKLIS
ncbi:MAG: Mrp/NBP35 family ATP-binding protein [Saccharofermentans sp.]|nr:Mrp/NBP35 family ATP-binding protein [Saccharofermentans sp.]